MPQANGAVLDATILDATVLDATSLHYRLLNQRVREIATEHSHIQVHNVVGQRYIGTNLGSCNTTLELHGTPGNDLGAFLNGADVLVHGNAQDGAGNTMSAGRIVVHGNAGDVAALSMRGGSIYIQGNVGYRCALHMKECGTHKPSIVVGGTSQDFFSEYMAGGIAVLLGLNLPDPGVHKARYMGSGMHGGTIFVRGKVDAWRLGKEVATSVLTTADLAELMPLLSEWAGLFGADMAEIMARPFVKLHPKNSRPYGNLYAY